MKSCGVNLFYLLQPMAGIHLRSSIAYSILIQFVHTIWVLIIRVTCGFIFNKKVTIENLPFFSSVVYNTKSTKSNSTYNVSYKKINSSFKTLNQVGFPNEFTKNKKKKNNH